MPRRKFQYRHSSSPPQNNLTRALDDLNAVGFLTDIQQRSPANLLCFGPKVTAW